MPLSDTFIRQVKYSGTKTGDKHTDGDGMYLLVNAVGKYWRLNYRFKGKQKTLALGVYPDVPLSTARKLRERAREQLATGVDPSAARKQQKASARAQLNTFEAIAREWLEKSGARRGEKTQSRVASWLDKNIFPAIGRLPIKTIRPRDVLGAVRTIEERGAIDSAKRVLGYCGQIFQYAIAIEACEHDITTGLHRALASKEETHYAAITDPAMVGGLLRAIHAYKGHLYCRAALKLAPLVFVRPGELRCAEWTEIDLERADWRIPGEKMKMDNDHVVPLATQAVAILRELYPITGSGRYVFPSIRTRSRPMSENTVNAALRAMGYGSDVMTGHGFRAMARTILDEVLGERVDLIEHQLAHAVKDVNGRAYNRTTHLQARREMMQRWADYLDKLRLAA
jgi:integrase